VGNTQGGHDGLKRSVIVAEQDAPAVSRSSVGYDANASRSHGESKSDGSKPVSRVEMIEKESASIAPSRWSSAGKSVMSAILTLSSLSCFFAALLGKFTGIFSPGKNHIDPSEEYSHVMKTIGFRENEVKELEERLYIDSISTLLLITENELKVASTDVLDARAVKLWKGVQAFKGYFDSVTKKESSPLGDITMDSYINTFSPMSYSLLIHCQNLANLSSKGDSRQSLEELNVHLASSQISEFSSAFSTHLMKPEPKVSSIQEEILDAKPTRNPDSITVNKELDESLADNESTGIHVFPGDDPDGLLSDIRLDIQRSKKAHIDEMSEMKAKIERLQSER